MKKNEIAREILTYLLDHPVAIDTLEGVAQWWLLERKINQVEMVKHALTELVAKGFLIGHQSEDGQTRYRLNKEKYERIKAFLKEMRKAK